jgi:hypothetical protein
MLALTSYLNPLAATRSCKHHITALSPIYVVATTSRTASFVTNPSQAANKNDFVGVRVCFHNSALFCTRCSVLCRGKHLGVQPEQSIHAAGHTNKRGSSITKTSQGMVAFKIR